MKPITSKVAPGAININIRGVDPTTARKWYELKAHYTGEQKRQVLNDEVFAIVVKKAYREIALEVMDGHAK